MDWLLYLVLYGFPIAMLIGALSGILEQRFSKTLSVIKNPTLGILDLTNTNHNELIAEDMRAIAPIFSKTLESNSNPPKCDVLFIYGTLQENGYLNNTDQATSNIIEEAGAKMAVFGLNNNIEYISQTNLDFLPVNSLITYDRKGNAFPQFYKDFFSEMLKGRSMPAVWADRTPQDPNFANFAHEEQPAPMFISGDDCPSFYFVCGAKQLTFSSKESNTSNVPSISR